MTSRARQWVFFHESEKMASRSVARESPKLKQAGWLFRLVPNPRVVDGAIDEVLNNAPVPFSLSHFGSIFRDVVIQ